ncbi:MAG: dihydrolipoyl dehydrogenase [Candidatus Omnitrophota bacterium]|nr:dihydrolipoyl dehydrogenase [Candidatus Omnitrophota bacterium]
MSSAHTQLVVIGGGPGGYAAAFLAADLGIETTLVDMDVNPGGVCLFRGCIPSKALLHVARILSESKDAEELGIKFAEPVVDIDKVRAWKDSVVSRLTGGLGQMCKLRKIRFVQGRATFLSSDSIKVAKTDGAEETITFDHAILATGSVPVNLPFAPASSRIMDSTAALNLEDVPKRLLVVGGGYIGLELGTFYCELGSKVTVVEMLPNLLINTDRDLATILEKRISTRFESIKVSTKVTQMADAGDGVTVTFEDKDGKSSSEKFDKVLVAIGRKPVTKNLGLENTKVELTDRGFVKVDGQRRTTDQKIYAIGDIAGDPMLAHKASHEGRVAVEAIAGHKVAFEPQAIPAVVFTDPEIAWCGITELEAKQQNRPVQVVKFPWGASGRAITLNRPDGLTKLIVDPESQRILGVAIVGVGAGELIAEGVLAVEMGSLVTDLKPSIHPHPTLSETFMETAENFFGQSTHVYRPKPRQN